MAMAAILDGSDVVLNNRETLANDPTSILAAFPPDLFDARVIERHLEGLSAVASIAPRVRVREIRLTRCKAGQRSVIEYDLVFDGPGGGERFTAIGKVRAEGVDERA